MSLSVKPRVFNVDTEIMVPLVGLRVGGGGLKGFFFLSFFFFLIQVEAQMEPTRKEKAREATHHMEN